MYLKKAILPVLAVACLLWSMRSFVQKQNKARTTEEHLPILAITQILEHPALDQERAGALDVLAKAGYVDGKTLKIVYQNAQGNVGTAAQIMNYFVGLHPTLVLTFSTPSAQAALGPCLSHRIPLVFSTVTDPLGAKLVKDLKRRTEGVTGVSDRLPIESQIQLVQDFLPDLKTLGIVYNPGESNSVNMVKAMREEAAKRKIQILEAVAGKTAEVTAAITHLVGKVQAVYVPNDNTAVAAMSSILQVAVKHNLPVFAGDTGSVSVGALATRGYDRFLLGQKAGELVVKILQGTPAGDLPVETTHPLNLWINQSASKKIGMTVPPVLLQSATVISGEK